MNQRVGYAGWVVSAVAVVVFALGASCSSGGAANPTGSAGSAGSVGGPASGGSSKKSDGIGCLTARDCAGGLCEQEQCSTPCKSNDDCRNGLDTCGITEAGRRCMDGCPVLPLQNSYTCIDDVPTACSIAGEGHCADCGCPSSLRCVAGQCIEKVAIGEDCRFDSDCKSDNCSGFAGVCRQPIGAPCTISECDVCIKTPNSTYCSRECEFGTQCGGGACMGRGDHYYCHLPCGSGCPGVCLNAPGFSPGSTVSYCDCDSADGCSLFEDEHPLGAPCRSDGICKSGHCELVATGEDPNYGTSYEGICSKPCTASSECGDGFSCAAVGTPHCLPHCESYCPVGECLELPTADGNATKVCWAKHGVGGFCADASDCQAGNCIKGVCASAGPQPNGSSCAASSDCLSNACQSGVCRGNGLQGDPCKIPADCSVGTCCTTGAQASTCALSC